jgi:molybdate transport system substrate-binding protein
MNIHRRSFLIGCITAVLMPLTAIAETPSLLIYCGITMVRPITEMGQVFEQKTGIKVTVTQGGSEDMYRSLKTSAKGDLYLPGEPNFRAKYLPEGLLGDHANIGFNQAALFVEKGNPKNIKADVKELLRSDISVTLSNVEQGSIGQETRRILTEAGIFDAAMSQASAIMPDSRTINISLKKKETDVSINWRTTAFFPDNKPHIDIIDLPISVAVPQALLLNALTFSTQPVAAKQFIDFATSDEGQAIMRKHGFLDAKKAS